MRWKTEQKSLRLDTPFLVRRESERRGPSVGGLDAMSQCNCFKIVKEGSNVIIVCQFCIPNVSLSLSPLCGWGSLFPARMSMFLVILRFLFFNSFPPSGAWAISLSGSGCDCRLRLHGCCADPRVGGVAGSTAGPKSTIYYTPNSASVPPKIVMHLL